MATLTVTLQEDLVLNNSQQGGTITKEVTGINESSKRMLTITTNESTIATMSGAVASSGHFNDSAVRYMRFTNLDGTNHVTLTFRNQDNDEFAMKVDAGNSFMVFADNSGGMVGMFNATQDADAASDTALGSITNIQADAGASTVRIEMFVATT
tara:strand:- start:1491 stop:1952 length:462 start_codon:yes stop_codon:yes gene_type:complete